MIVGRVRRTIRERALFKAGDVVVVGVSGGPDSAGLLCALARLRKELGLRIFAVSVNHGLRAEAVRDVEIAAEQAAQMDVPFAQIRLQVGQGAGLQARARSLRYEALLEHMRAVGGRALAVGHTQDDQAETVLMRQLRGAGVRGLGGVQPAREDGVVRPLIDCSRGDVHEFAHEAFVAIASDASNKDNAYTRVRVRESLLPAIQSEDPAIATHLTQLADEAREIVRFLDRLAVDCLQDIRSENRALLPTELPLAALRAIPNALLVPVLRAWLYERTGEDPGRAHLNQVRSCVRGRGEVLLKRGWGVTVVDLPNGSLGLSLASPAGRLG